MSHADLIIAIPSKGRLQENTNDFFRRAGLSVLQPGGDRNYRGELGGVPGVEVAFLSASEISKELALGNVHFGVTGLDLIHETIVHYEDKVHLVTPLGFGFANVVVAVPMAWIDVASMSDLADISAEFRQRNGQQMRIATKYMNLTRRYFAANGIADYRIVESLGATEGAPAAGSAEAIVDITTTGSTLAANSLKVLSDGTLLKSQAYLVASLAAPWSVEASDRAHAILDRISAEAAARSVKEIRAAVSDGAEAAAAAVSLGATLPFGTATQGPTVLTLHAPVKQVAAIARALRDHGAETVTVSALEYVFSSVNSLAFALQEAVERKAASR
ncbi:MAG: ATP phosphoribosyltransferase [Ancalomicrobiaceae bacterium]|nr:ATP phosphoribosyltransferase [Ancalomicrobiaceae bacterium]